MSIQIRPATEADIPQIHAINVHYILNTSLTFLQSPVPKSTLATNFDEISNVRGLPYLVAVEPGTGNPPSYGLYRRAEGVIPGQNDPATAGPSEDVVVGYSYLSPFRGHMLSYAPTVELTLFVHPDHQSRSVGSQLFAAILAKAQDPTTRHGAREVTELGGDGEGTELLDVLAGDDGEGAKIRNILAVMAVDPEGKDGGEALLAWYQKKGFTQSGRMKHIGFKKGRWLDTVYLQYDLQE